ncbi:hypothetical protein [Effusibacillus consociatus]|uniref:Uncharacterized protein n=1 Tax=Effusibacillus consociatus TaxID=1117041 RepID=A0ABV9PUV6_9BACL
MIITNATYDEAKQKGESVPDNHSIQVKDAQNRNLPKEGEAYSSKDLVNPDGSLVTRRYYDQDGKVELDIDYGDHGTPEKTPLRIDILLIGRSWVLKILEVNRLTIGQGQTMVQDQITAQG